MCWRASFLLHAFCWMTPRWLVINLANNVRGITSDWRFNTSLVWCGGRCDLFLSSFLAVRCRQYWIIHLCSNDETAYFNRTWFSCGFAYSTNISHDSNALAHHLSFSKRPRPAQYDKLSKLIKDFQPYRDLWTTTSDWIRWHESWMNDPLTSIDAEQLERNVNESFRTLHKCVKQFKEIPGRLECCALLACCLRVSVRPVQRIEVSVLISHVTF